MWAPTGRKHYLALSRPTAKVACAATLIAMLTACQNAGDSRGIKSPAAHDLSASSEEQRRVYQASRPVGFIFDDLPTLVATSEYVILGTVTSAGKGELLSKGDTLYQRDLQFSIERQFYGEELPETVVVHQAGYEGDTPFELADQRWLYPGDRALVFVNHDAQNSPELHFDIVAAPGLIEFRGTQGVHSDASDPVTRRIEGLPEAAVVQMLADAVETVRQGGVRPLVVDGGTS